MGSGPTCTRHGPLAVLQPKDTVQLMFWDRLGSWTGAESDKSRVLRNTLAQLLGQPVSWMLTLGFMTVVPRSLGADEWGVWTAAWAVGLTMRAVLDMGVNTVVLKAVARRSESARHQIGVAIALRLVLAPALIAGVVGFGQLAGYGPHTRVVLTFVAATLAISYVGTPMVFGLQAFQKIHVTTIAGIASGLIMTPGAILAVKVFGLGLLGVCLMAVASNVVGIAVQWIWLKQSVRITAIFAPSAMLRMARAGIPYYLSALFFTIYVWADGIMLSLLVPAREVGWYGVCVQLISTLGVVPYAVTTAVLPVLARTFHTDEAATAGLGTRSFQFVAGISLPVGCGLALVAPSLITLVYGSAFAPAGSVLVVLALTLPPVYIATLVNGFILAADRQAQWTAVMAALCIVNPLLNLLTIPYFHAAAGNGALGAAVALLATDALTGVAALALLPPKLRRSVASAWPMLGRSAIATAVMFIVVLPLRSSFVVIPVLAGVLVFATLAVLLDIYPGREGLRMAIAYQRRRLPRHGVVTAPTGPTE